MIDAIGELNIKKWYDHHFSTYYCQHLKPLVDKYEMKRQNAVNHHKKRKKMSFIISCLGVIFVFAILAIFGRDGGLQIIFFPIVIGFYIVKAWINSPIENYKNSIHKSIYPIFFKYFGDDFVFKKNISWIKEISDSNLLPSYDYYINKNYVKGSHKSVKIEMFETKLSKKNKLNDNSHVVFHGLFFLITTKRNISGRIIINNNSLINKIKKNKNKKNLERIYLEDPLFDASFSVYGEDQIEARTILTVSFMQRLLDLEKIISSKKLECSFFDNKLVILLPEKNHYFEPNSIYRKVNFEENFRRIKKEMNIIFDIINTLKLDMDIGL